MAKMAMLHRARRSGHALACAFFVGATLKAGYTPRKSL